MGILQPFFQVFLLILSIIEWIVIIWVVISWVLFFAAQTSFRWRYPRGYQILNQLNDIFSRMASPFLRPFRRILPPHKMAGIDWSPILLLIAIFLLRGIVAYLYGLILFR